MDHTKTAIIVFTKDRPDVLLKTIEGIKNETVSIIVIDDSYFIKNRIENRKKIQKYLNVSYHGRKEQAVLLKSIDIDGLQLKKFINRLGCKGWNLGYVRNYAIFLARSMQMRKILFMDDDIIVKDQFLISKIFKLLDDYDFIGAKVIGMIDDSVVGYIARELFYPVEEYMSGGFIAFNPPIVTEYFINQYNEDWIWMYFHQTKCKCHLYGEVTQLSSDKFMNAIKKAKKQEVGEILVDGVKEMFEDQNFFMLNTIELWNRLLLEKQEYYMQLKTLSLRENREDLYKILDSVSIYSAKLKSRSFVDIFKRYFTERRVWDKILKTF